MVYFNSVATKEDCQARERNAFESLSPDSIKATTDDELIRRCENVWKFKKNSLTTFRVRHVCIHLFNYV